MKLTRPLIFFDLETTGINRSVDKIVQISVTKISPPDIFTGERETKTRLVNPGIEIPLEAISVHGIDNDKVKDAPLFRQIAKGIFDFIAGCDVIGFNSNSYDVPMLSEEFARAGIIWRPKSYLHPDGFLMGDSCIIFKKHFPRTLSDAYLEYTGQVMENAHSAEDDVKATVDVFLKQLQFEGMPDTMEGIHDFCIQKPIIDLQGYFSMDKDNDIIFNFDKKRKGKKIKNDIPFLKWMVNKGDFPNDTIEIALQFINKKI